MRYDVYVIGNGVPAKGLSLSADESIFHIAVFKPRAD